MTPIVDVDDHEWRQQVHRDRPGNDELLYVFQLSLSLIPDWGDGSPPQSSPVRSTGISDRFGSGGWATNPAEPGQSCHRPQYLDTGG